MALLELFRRLFPPRVLRARAQDRRRGQHRQPRTRRCSRCKGSPSWSAPASGASWWGSSARVGRCTSTPSVSRSAAIGTWLLVTDRRPDPGVERPKKGERDLGAGMRILFGDGVLRPLVITFVVFLLALGHDQRRRGLLHHQDAPLLGRRCTDWSAPASASATSSAPSASRKVKQHDVSLAKASLLGVARDQRPDRTSSDSSSTSATSSRSSWSSAIAVGVLNVTITTLMTDAHARSAARADVRVEQRRLHERADHRHRLRRVDPHARRAAHCLSDRGHRHDGRRVGLRSLRASRDAFSGEEPKWKLRAPDARASSRSAIE